MASPVRAEIRPRRASACGSASGPSTSRMRPQRTQVKWWCASRLASKRGVGSLDLRHQPLGDEEAEVAVAPCPGSPGATGGAPRGGPTPPSGVIRCPGAPRGRPGAGPVRRRPRTRRAASEFLGMVLIYKRSATRAPPIVSRASSLSRVSSRRGLLPGSVGDAKHRHDESTGCSALAASGKLSISGGPVECLSPCGSGSREPGRTI